MYILFCYKNIDGIIFLRAKESFLNRSLLLWPMRKTLLPYGMPTVDEDDINSVVFVLKTRWLTTGPKVDEFEKKLSLYTGSKYASVVNSGTAALDLAVAALDLPKGSEIITTPLTFVATANSILYNDCVPIFADIQEDTFNIDPAEVKKKITKKTRAILSVDFAGQPCDMAELRKISDKNNLALISDSAHSIGASYGVSPGASIKSRKVGSIADITTFSFHPVKTMTTGEGGAVTTDNETYHRRIRILRNHGIDKNLAQRESERTYAYDAKFLGRNYRLTDFQCALGISQLKKLDYFVQRRNELAKEYNSSLKNVKGIRLPIVRDNVKSAWHLYTILITDAAKYSRDVIFKKMLDQNIGVNVHYVPVYTHSLYKRLFKIRPSDFPVTDKVSNQILTLPLFPNMTSDDVRDVVDALKISLK